MRVLLLALLLVAGCGPSPVEPEPDGDTSHWVCRWRSDGMQCSQQVAP